ncbi:hypothetical protein [Methanolapillus millepedarum]|uniref:Uncharacterized protein n=1 Tax=Methanolapillus millepedarum TaxID=3028296 RepID=A0AA96VGR2_9EURY|nr:hypothetical protein MsAc7_18130 [Methanosarcinaceae archaeon Ac7]
MDLGEKIDGMSRRYLKKPPSCIKPADADETTCPLSDYISFKRTLSDFDLSFSSFLLFSTLSSLFLFSKMIED